MEEKKVFCRRAEELKSIDELNLSDDIVRLFSLSDINMEEMIAHVRWLDMRWYYDAMYFWDTILIDARRSIDEELMNELNNGSRGCDYLSEIVDSLKKAGFLNEDIKYLYRIAGRYALPGGKGFRLAEAWDQVWLEGGEEACVGDSFHEFNKHYESFNSNLKEKVERILEVFRDGLTSGQYDMAKFDLNHLRLHSSRYMNPSNRGIPTESNGFFVLSDEDCCNLESARHNSQWFFKEEVMAIILS